ncbi:MAG: hypothetical protein PF574_09665 [Candidatus Delongbacteria bacterium]|jgi:hypothetical protein|nr:hypothetical protein [Candidatus Delongbacteria bacterium]
MILNFVKKHGKIKASAILTFVIIFVTLSVTYPFIYINEGTVCLYQMMLPTVMPIALFFIPAIFFFDILIRLDTAEKDLQIKNTELEKSLDEIKILEGLFPICSSCKSIRDDEGEWNQIERYIEKKSDATFSHSLCPDCFTKLYPTIKRNGSK